MDRLSKQRRSWNMGRIRNRDTRPERIVRSALHRMGFRFRLKSQRLPGSPDIVLTRHGMAVFVHGCFWHRHPRCTYTYMPKSNRAFWLKKFAQNQRRDRAVRHRLRRMGWRALTIWECETHGVSALAKRLRRLLPRGRKPRFPVVLTPLRHHGSDRTHSAALRGCHSLPSNKGPRSRRADLARRRADGPIRPPCRPRPA